MHYLARGIKVQCFDSVASSAGLLLRHKDQTISDRHCWRRNYDEYTNPRFFVKEDRARAWDVLSHDFRRWRRRYYEKKYDYYHRKGMTNPMRAVMQYELFPIEANFLIIGGGLMGSCVAWWLKQRARDEDFRVVVIESDDTFTQNSTGLSLGSIRTQFSCPEHVQMSLFGAEFLRNAGSHLRILDNDPPNIDFYPMGHLFLCDSEERAKRMETHHKMQLDNGAKVVLLNRDQLRERYPFMNVDDIVLGSIGLENEGIVDPWQLLSAFREKNVTLGVQYVKARLSHFVYETAGDLMTFGLYKPNEKWRLCRLADAVVKPEMSDCAPRPIQFSAVVNCAGPWAGEVGKMAGFGVTPGEGFLSIPVPVEKRKRCVFAVHCPDGPGLDMPFIIDPSGVWCRRDGPFGNLYLCGKTPTPEEDKQIDHSDLSVDYNIFDQLIWPVLAKRVPAFANLKIKSAWAGYYDRNLFDDGCVFGNHFVSERFFNVCGFNGMGLQHAIAAGRAVMEKWYDGAYIGLNMRPFGLERMLRNRRIVEEYQI